MNLSFRPPNADYLGFEATPHGIVSTTQRAETLGFDTIFLNDHVIVPENMAKLWGNVFDPLASLAYLAAATDKIRLGTSVLIVPYRNPIVTAKTLATIDQFSNGRLVLGVGAGWSEAEYAALGVPHERRGALTDEYIDVWKACWSPDPISFSGPSVHFQNMYSSPKPVQQPHPPLWVGGSTHAALRRAARIAEVWQPVPTALEQMQGSYRYLSDACEQIGRDSLPQIRMSFRVNFSAITGVASTDPKTAERLRGHGTPEQVLADMLVYRDQAQVEAFQINFNGCGSLSQLEESMELFATEVWPHL